MSELTGRILVADDEESIRWVLVTALKGEGHNVDQTDGGETALQRLTGDRYDLALIDIKMPDLDGLSLLSKATAAGSVSFASVSRSVPSGDGTNS